ncbi:hypothetical protein GobsT_71910 [Gemmata obscuriglobus]|uniref:Uncharacterized protein n=1 Tax=Gemmata obscuriglobus TaxID=114 RepID=A0A2Z3HFH8_9BACT|nr:hypothetical protein [Gemmata obscuriglobus]AWM41715.1 hypothetical protein C1280_35120 [Gemmata obscuriglobus]QEG32336.1 hypothetical protein GobsT_71910 [Gemmata obscuriglobus]VTS11692.1 Uncharacterized protein OS=Rhodopirellula sp. SWK7 GN=RRSWK_01485 PE=4 SV=1 [Gemmata obscuriglobus UQM 2246]
MSNFIAIDLEAGGVYAVSGGTRGGAKVLHALAWTNTDEEPPPPLSAETAKSFGEALRAKLKDAGIAPAPVLVSVGRDRVILKELRHPPVPPADEPAVIRFQAVKEMSESPDDVVLDYVPIGDTSAGAGERRAMAVMLRKDVLNAITAMTTAAGLKLAGATPRPYAVAAGLGRAFALGAAPAPEQKTDTVAALTLGPGGGEFTVVRGGEMVLTLAIPAPVMVSEAMLVAQLRRNLTVYAGQHPGHPITAVYLAEVGPGWAGRLETALGVPVHDYDPLAGAVPKVPEHLRGRFAGAVGLLAAKAHAADLPINFASPRQPRTTGDPGKRRLLFAALAAVLLVGGSLAVGVLLRDWAVGGVEALAAERDELKGRIEKGAAGAKQADAIDAWTKRRVVYLDELHDLADRMPGDDSIRVTEIKSTPGQITKDGKQPVQANVELRVAAVAGPPVHDLVSAFENDNPRPEAGKVVNKYYIGTNPTGGGALTSSGSSKHTQGFTVKTQVNYREPNKYDRAPKFTPPKRSWGLPASQ